VDIENSEYGKSLAEIKQNDSRELLRISSRGNLRVNKLLGCTCIFVPAIPSPYEERSASVRSRHPGKLSLCRRSGYTLNRPGKRAVPMAEKSKHVRGFTLIELLIAVAIIGILSAIAVPSLSAYRDRAKVAAAKAELKQVQNAIGLLEADCNRWPGPSTPGVTANQEVWNLNSPNAGLVATNGGFPDWYGPYVQSVPLDPWGNNYFFDPDYTLNGTTVAVVGSFGRNQVGPNVYDSDNVILILPTR
jgi:general secretion pathway protein G